jgi:L-ribulose-5-phosphate 4-epimerase
MLLPSLREEVLHANQEISRLGLAVHTFGNASGIDRGGIDGSGKEPIVAIKPSGVSYATLKAEDLVLTTIHGIIVEGKLNPSSDLETHLLLYREFPQIGGVVHTHSEFATAWAQSCQPIPCLGTTHADYFHGPVPVTEALSAAEVEAAYVLNTGAVIARLFREQNLDPVAVPGVLVAGHAPFAWGKNAASAVEHADLLEYIARLAWRTVVLGAPAEGLAHYVAEHHYQRKHGPRATYGQR